MSLRLVGLRKRFGATVAVDEVSLELQAGETLALLGPSGCGKSTLLRLVAGLERPNTGRVLFAGDDLTSRPPQRRGFGMVFQDYALFPHLNVFQNVAYGLVEQGWPKSDQRERVAELLSLVDLEGFETRRVTQLSGGQQQRVALARALAPKPRLLLLDEPLSNLDLSLRDDLKEALRGLLDRLEIGALYVTHDQTEAFTVASRVAVMRAGKLLQVGDAETLYGQPASAWVARFLGHPNLYETTDALRALAGGPLTGPFVLLRGDLVRLGGGAQRARLEGHTQVGALHLLDLHLEAGLKLRWMGFARELPERVEVGDTLELSIPPGALVELAE